MIRLIGIAQERLANTPVLHAVEAVDDESKIDVAESEQPEADQEYRGEVLEGLGDAALTLVETREPEVTVADVAALLEEVVTTRGVATQKSSITIRTGGGAMPDPRKAHSMSGTSISNRPDRRKEVKVGESKPQTLKGQRGGIGEEDELLWQDRALCAQTDPETFFPEKGGSTREAKKVCLSCDVRSECLDYATTHDERFGIWGGLSERERRKLKNHAI